jgi:hypothetical protein
MNGESRASALVLPFWREARSNANMFANSDPAARRCVCVLLRSCTIPGTAPDDGWFLALFHQRLERALPILYRQARFLRAFREPTIMPEP